MTAAWNLYLTFDLMEINNELLEHVKCGMDIVHKHIYIMSMSHFPWGNNSKPGDGANIWNYILQI